MSLHSYSRCWLHLVWATLNRESLLNTAAIQKQLSEFLYDYSLSKHIFMKRNYVNKDHIHALVDLPTNLTIEDVFHLLKGASSNWINKNKLCSTKFHWGRGYGVFSVSESVLPKVIRYIDNQEEHHRDRSFSDEYKSFIEHYGMQYKDE